MNEKELAKLKQLAQDECDARIAAAKADLKSRLEALEWARRNCARPSSSSPAKGKRVDGTVLEAIRAVLPSLPMVIDVTRVQLAAQQWATNHGKGEIKKMSVSSALKRLAASGQLRVVEVGKGKKPSLYQRPEPGEPTSSEQAA